MARTRSIKPSFFTNEELSRLSPLARLLFIGLWTQADREGRLEDRPRRLKAMVLPYDRCSIEAQLSALCAGGFIVRYSTEIGRIIQIVNFTRHQQPHHKETASVLPSYVECAPEAGAHSKGTEVMLDSSMKQASVMHDPSTADASGEHVHASRNDGSSKSPVDSPEPLASSLELEPSSPPFIPPWDDGQSSAPDGAPTKTAGAEVKSLTTTGGAEPDEKPARRKKPRTSAPDITPTPEMYAWALENVGFDERKVNLETLKMLDHHRAAGNLMADWRAAWQKWMRNAVEFGRGRQSTAGGHSQKVNPAQAANDAKAKRHITWERAEVKKLEEAGKTSSEAWDIVRGVTA